MSDGCALIVFIKRRKLSILLSNYYWNILLFFRISNQFNNLIIGFFQAKPLAKEEKKAEATSNQKNDEYFEEVPNKPAKDSNKKIPFDDILKAKELFDAGAITQEEFTEIKRRAIE